MTRPRNSSALIPAALLCVATLLMPAGARAQGADRWQYAASLNLWFPSLSGTATFPGSGGSADASIDASKILENLHFAFAGSFEARRGAWGLFTDVVYLDLGAGKSGARSLNLGGLPLPLDVNADVHMDMSGLSWTLGGSYRALTTPDYTFDVVAGARLADLTVKLDWTLRGNIGSVPVPDHQGSREFGVKNWDAVIGVKGRYLFGEGLKWSVPYFFDVGTGDSDLTTQVLVGIGYSFGWGEVVGTWRVLDYNLKSSSGLQDLTFSGPVVSAVFRW
jgi:hypothetical protein